MAGLRIPLGALAALALLAPVVWAWSRGGIAPVAPERAAVAAPAGGPSADDADDLASLRNALAAERERNLALVTENAWLRRQLEQGVWEGDLPAPEPGDPAAGAEAPLSPLAGGDPALFERDGEEAGEEWFDADSLAAAGVPADRIERLREVFDRTEMQLIDLRHEAKREGWIGRSRYHEAVHDLRSGLREEIGDEDFDLLLYASGRHNRVVVEGVLRNSPSDRYGLQPGDVIVRYGDERIFKMPALQRATTRGKLGDRVMMEVLRDGERVRIHGEVGPLGIKMRPARQLPESTW